MIRPIHIKAVLNGFIVEIGCQTIVFAGPEAGDQLAFHLKDYLKDPNGVERVWLDTSLNAKHVGGYPAATEAIDRPEAPRMTAMQNTAGAIPPAVRR